MESFASYRLCHKSCASSRFIAKFFLIIFFIFFILFIINNYIRMMNTPRTEYFDKNSDGTVCGTENDVCSINDETGENSCCKNLHCIRKPGNYQYKVCSKENSEPEKNNINTSFLSKIFSFGNEYDSEEMDDNSNLNLQLKDMCGHPYKINLNPYFGKSNKRTNMSSSNTDSIFSNLFSFGDKCLL